MPMLTAAAITASTMAATTAHRPAFLFVLCIPMLSEARSFQGTDSLHHYCRKIPSANYLQQQENLHGALFWLG
jgi:hypothetical protein